MLDFSSLTVVGQDPQTKQTYVCLAFVNLGMTFSGHEEYHLSQQLPSGISPVLLPA